ncbi:MAG: ABC transporter ATP-binding protein [Symbiobacterium sp.]|uniref:ABC transporter ATP-binding protein n=1 Tax=Symbiobacterium sp. TaxID=1971213 RepID=UPI003464C9B5
MVEFRGVSKTFGSTEALTDLNLEIRPGEFLTLLGPSGCGKTTTLRLLAGFEEPTCGEIWLAGKPVQGLPAYKRPVNTVFQHYALFPHMTVFDNVAFGLRMQKVPQAEIKRRVTAALELVRLEGMGGRRPHELSGGQQQRVALARALVLEPKVLLLDEPLGALDLQLRRAMQVELRQLQRRLGATFLYVTHDQEEALAMSDRIAVMRNGRIEQLGTPEEVYLRPATRFVAQFLGEANLLEGEGAASGRLRWGDYHLLVDRHVGPGRTTVALRPEQVRVRWPGSATPVGPAENRVHGIVAERLFVGTGVRLVVEVAGRRLAALLPAGPGPDLGDQVELCFSAEHCVVVAP